MPYKISLTSLGCDKNLVDSERMLGIVNKKGYKITMDESEADIIIVNTCSFINDAKEESIETILELGANKETGNCKALIVTGCMAERYKDEILEELPEVDAVLGTTAYDQIVEVIEKSLEGEKPQAFADIDKDVDSTERLISTPGYYGYLKIAEGCNNFCTYCIIPKLRGKYRSEKIEDLVKEAEDIVKRGVKELIVIAQDTTKYGLDRYNKKMLPKLLTKLCDIDGLKWVRVLYCYPEEITDELIDAIANNEKICKYIDMPIQHCNDEILKRMGRKSSKEKIKNVINKMRATIPDMAIRTTLITGFPGETEEQFQEMKEFITEMKFDRLGVFTYSPEEGTVAAEFENQIDEEIKEKRKEELMLIQQEITSEIQKSMIGKEVKVIVDGKLPEGVYCGRTYRDLPDIDGLVFINSEEEVISGDFVHVTITDSNEYDLIGEIKDEYSE